MKFNLKKWFNKNIVLLLFLFFMLLLYVLFAKSIKSFTEGLNESSLSNIKKWKFHKSNNWYTIKQGEDSIPFSETGFDTNKPEITIVFLLNNLHGQPYWRNIFHFTNTDHACCEKGDRIPAMWVTPDNTNNFHITISTEGYGNDWFNTNNNMPFGIPVFIAVVVQKQKIQYYVNNILAMEKNYDSYILYRTKTTKLYIGNPWEQQDGNIHIKDFTLYDGALTQAQINEVYKSMTDINANKTNDNAEFENDGLQFTIYNGYFNDNLSFFNNNLQHYDNNIYYGATNFESINKATNGKKAVDISQTFSVVWEGYLLSDYNGVWTFGLNSDDASYMWIGQYAEKDYTVANAHINNGNLHGMVNKTCNVYLVKGYYPIRIIFGQNYGGVNCQFYYSNGNNAVNSYNFKGKFFATPNPVATTPPVQPIQPIQPVQPIQPIQPIQPVQPIQPASSLVANVVVQKAN